MMCFGNLASKGTITLILIFFAQTVAGQTQLLRQPDLSATHLVFAYAGDLYVSDPLGANPRRLTVGAAEESHPHISPDGTMVAFTGHYEGNADVYVMPITGGQPVRLSYHPGDDWVRGWSADGSAVLFSSDRGLSYQRGGQLFEIALKNGIEPHGLPRALPMPIAWDGAYAPDGGQIAYQPFPSGYSGSAGWKGYRGGTTPPIWIFDTKSHEISAIPNDGVNDAHPIWLDNSIFFVSDRDGVANLWSYDLADQTLRQHTYHKDWDIKSAAGYGRRIVYELGGRLHLYDLETDSTKALAIDLTVDLPAARPKWIEGKDYIAEARLSPDGQTTLLSVRGEIISLSVNHDEMIQITRSSGAHDRAPLWSPDGRKLAYLSDQSGEYALYVGAVSGLGTTTYYDLAGAPATYRLHAITPDGSAILYEDNHLNLYEISLKDGTSVRIGGHARRWYPHGFALAVSPDSRYVVFRRANETYLNSLMIHDRQSRETFSLTNGPGSLDAPVFSRDGKYLFFTASTNSGPAGAWLDMSNQDRVVRRGVYAAVLSASDPTPVLPEIDQPSATPNPPGDSRKKTRNKAAAPDPAAPPQTRLDREGLEKRIVALPMVLRDYNRLMIGKDGALYALALRPDAAEESPPGRESDAVHSLYRFDFKTHKESLFLADVGEAEISADGDHLLVSRPKKSWAVVETGTPTAPMQGIKDLALDKIRLQIDPRAEWRQIFNEVWRLERDYFYDPAMHGLDWEAVRQKYAPMLDHLGRREDLTHILIEMISELGVGHARASGGDIVKAEGQKVGLLGADFRVANGYYQISRIYDGESFNPFLGAPLAVPGLGVKAGHYLLAINGQPITASDNPYRFLEGTVGRQTLLHLNDKPEMKGAYSIIVQPIPNERGLRRWAWIEDNRRHVAALTDDRVGYVYLPNTAADGFSYFNRYFFSQLDKQALIIDERGNAGGQAANYIVDLLNRSHLASWKDRDGALFTTPVGAIFGPKVMLIDQFAGSGGDFLPFAFKYQTGGTLIGTRTWGGLIGIGVAPDLIDGGRITTPYFRFIHPKGGWAIENEGVSPDITVDMTPKAVIEGRDPQLDKAIAVILQQLGENPPPKLPGAPEGP
jgi:tricorn protease